MAPERWRRRFARTKADLSPYRLPHLTSTPVMPARAVASAGRSVTERLGTSVVTPRLQPSRELKEVGTSTNLTNSNNVADNTGSDVTATTSDLFFNYGGTDSGYLLFQVNLFPCASVVTQSPSDPSGQFEARKGNQIIGTAASAVPEPPSWTIMLLGMGGLGAAMGLRRKQITTTA
jgi:PEP-CTERM motif